MVRISKRTYRNIRKGKTFKPYVSYRPENLEKAIEAVQNKTLSLKNAADMYDVPKTTIWRKINKTNDSQEKAGHPTLFSPTEEKSFIKHMKILAEWGFPFDFTDLRILAQKYLNKIGKTIYSLKDNTPGTDWARNFLLRHKDELSNRLASNISTERAKVTPEIIDKFFENYVGTVEGVSPDCIINYDETNLTDDPGNKKYIYRRGTKYPERVINNSKTAISLMFTGTADGHLLDIYVVYKADHLWDTWLEGGPPHTRYNRSKSGWFDGVCFEDWFNTVIVPYAKTKTGRKVIIGDNLSSHFSEGVLKTCEELNIAFVCLPPKTTHLLQPLDVAFYAPLKHYWREILTEWKKVEGRKHKTLSKSAFPQLLTKLKNKLIEKGSESNNLIAGFNKAGLYPVNPERPKSRLPRTSNVCANQEEINNTTAEVVTEILREMRGSVISGGTNGTTKRKKKCNVPAGKSITAADILQDTANTTKNNKKGKKKKILGKNKGQRSPANSTNRSSDEEYVNEIDSDVTFVQSEISDNDMPRNLSYEFDVPRTTIKNKSMLDTSAGPSGINNNKPAIKRRKMATDKNLVKKRKILAGKNVSIASKSQSGKGKGIGKKSKTGKENQGPDVEKCDNLLSKPNKNDASNRNNSIKKYKRRLNRKISSEDSSTSVSDIISEHSDSDLINLQNYDYNSSDPLSDLDFENFDNFWTHQETRQNENSDTGNENLTVEMTNIHPTNRGHSITSKSPSLNFEMLEEQITERLNICSPHNKDGTDNDNANKSKTAEIPCELECRAEEKTTNSLNNSASSPTATTSNEHIHISNEVVFERLDASNQPVENTVSNPKTAELPLEFDIRTKDTTDNLKTDIIINNRLDLTPKNTTGNEKTDEFDGKAIENPTNDNLNLTPDMGTNQRVENQSSDTDIRTKDTSTDNLKTDIIPNNRLDLTPNNTTENEKTDEFDGKAIENPTNDNLNLTPDMGTNQSVANQSSDTDIRTKDTSTNNLKTDIIPNNRLDFTPKNITRNEKTDEFDDKAIDNPTNDNLNLTPDMRTNQSIENQSSDTGISYSIDDFVLVRYYQRKKWTYYVGFIQNIKSANNETYYSIRYLKTIKKPELKFVKTRKIDRDEVTMMSIVKKLNLSVNYENPKEYFLCDDEDSIYF